MHWNGRPKMRRMGRRRQRDLELPPRMRKKGSAFYRVGGSPQKWTPLGKDK